jgi:hypothetical protein
MDTTWATWLHAGAAKRELKNSATFADSHISHTIAIIIKEKANIMAVSLFSKAFLEKN